MRQIVKQTVAGGLPGAVVAWFGYFGNRESESILRPMLGLGGILGLGFLSLIVGMSPLRYRWVAIGYFLAVAYPGAIILWQMFHE